MSKGLPYRTTFHGSFDEEWGRHHGTSEWWYLTGFGRDRDGRLLSWQFTIVKAHLRAVDGWVAMVAVTDVQAGRHHYSQHPTPRPAKVTDRSVSMGETASAIKRGSGMQISGRGGDFGFDLDLDYGKGPVWHCDDGVLQMGARDAESTTLYYSYPNMPTTGVVTLDGQEIEVTGKSWFDKQGGTFDLFDRRTHWEWFSLRFDDDTEAMLFSFPQSDYADGTFIDRDGNFRRLNDYTIESLRKTTAAGYQFSTGWRVDLPGIADRPLTIEPLIEGQLNLAYFELLAAIKDDSGREIGMCFVELLPGVLNDHVNPLHLFRPSKA